MKRLMMSGVLLLGMIGNSFGANTEPGSGPQDIDSETCITMNDAARVVIQNVPDAIGLVNGNTIIFSSSSYKPDTNLVVTFDEKGCAKTTEVVPSHKS